VTPLPGPLRVRELQFEAARIERRAERIRARLLELEAKRIEIGRYRGKPP
jgi:hypothetical protein